VAGKPGRPTSGYTTFNNTAASNKAMTTDTPPLNWLYELQCRAADANAWARHHWRMDDLASSTRCPALSPLLGDGGGVTAVLVDDVACRRAAALRAAGIVSTRPCDGRILAFDPQQSLSDGAAAAESGGFFSDDNMPPWDCWLMFVEETPRYPDRWTEFDSYLLCWIPSSVVRMAARAIEVNPEQCLRWADELDTPALAQLTYAGIRLPGG
jgi:hypothetical protein